MKKEKRKYASSDIMNALGVQFNSYIRGELEKSTNTVHRRIVNLVQLYETKIGAEKDAEERRALLRELKARIEDVKAEERSYGEKMLEKAKEDYAFKTKFSGEKIDYSLMRDKLEIQDTKSLQGIIDGANSLTSLETKAGVRPEIIIAAAKILKERGVDYNINAAGALKNINADAPWLNTPEAQEGLQIINDWSQPEGVVNLGELPNFGEYMFTAEELIDGITEFKDE